MTNIIQDTSGSYLNANGYYNPTAGSGYTSNFFDDVIDPSGKVKNIVDNEKTRLDDKEEIIDELYFSKQRNDDFVKSETDRNNAYYRLVLIILGVFILCFLIYYLQSFFPFIPDLVIEILYIIVVAGGIIWLLLKYSDIQRRSRLDYNKIDFDYLLKEKNIVDTTNKSLVSRGTKVRQEISRNCVGAACCPSGSKFINNRCESFATMTTNKSIKSEFLPYSILPQYSESTST